MTWPEALVTCVAIVTGGIVTAAVVAAAVANDRKGGKR